jgi:enoyl-CoA hydratase
LLEIRKLGSGVQVWIMRFPPVNAIGPDLLAELSAGLAALDGQDDITVVILGSGERVFSAGADAKWMADVVQSEGAQSLLTRFQGTMDHFRAVCAALRSSKALIVAALNGHTLAGGLELAAACDLRFCADDERIRIGVPEMKLFGVLPSGGGGTQYLVRLMGASRALDLILEAEPVTPARALEVGIVERLYPADELMARCEAFAQTVAGRAGRIGVAAAKRAVHHGAELSLADALVLDDAVHWDAMRRGGFIKGAEAFVEQYGKRL